MQKPNFITPIKGLQRRTITESTPKASRIVTQTTPKEKNKILFSSIRETTKAIKKQFSESISPFKTAQHSRQVSNLNNHDFGDATTQCSSQFLFKKSESIVFKLSKNLARKETQIQQVGGDYEKSFQDIMEEEMDEEFLQKEPETKIKTQRKRIQQRKVIMPDDDQVESEIFDQDNNIGDQFKIKLTWPDGRRYVGDWNFVDGRMGEEGTFFWSDGSSYTTKFKFGRFHLSGTYKNSFGYTKQLYYKNGVRLPNHQLD